MTSDYIPLAILFIVAILVAIIAVGLGYLFGPKRPSARKSAPYESGMRPIGPGTRRISVRFYLIAVLFILFDIEVVFFLPWAVVLRSFHNKGWGTFALVEMFVFLAILLVGYIYAWKKGALEWE
jgi:NADH-quinone oxidoreductase subunit A